MSPFGRALVLMSDTLTEKQPGGAGTNTEGGWCETTPREVAHTKAKVRIMLSQCKERWGHQEPDTGNGRSRPHWGYRTKRNFNCLRSLGLWFLGTVVGHIWKYKLLKLTQEEMGTLERTSVGNGTDWVTKASGKLSPGPEGWTGKVYQVFRELTEIIHKLSR